MAVGAGTGSIACMSGVVELDHLTKRYGSARGKRGDVR